MDHAHLKLKCWAETAHCLCNNDQMHEERKQPFQHRIWIWMCRPPCPPFLGTSLVVYVPVSNTCTPLEGFCTFNETSEICRIFQRKCASFSGLTLQTTISYVYIIYVFLRICICIWLQRQVNSKNTARIMIESHYAFFPGSAAGAAALRYIQVTTQAFETAYMSVSTQIFKLQML